MVIRRRFDAADRKSSTEGQDVNKGPAPPNPSDGKTVTETRADITALLPKDHGRRSATGLKARALFIGLAGALVTALLLSVTPNRPELVTSHPAREAMAPATWSDIYATISARNAFEREQRSHAIKGRKRALSPVHWSAEDCTASVHSEEDGNWAEYGSSEMTTAGGETPDPLTVERCPSCGTRTYGWGGFDCGRAAHKAEDAAQPWVRSPGSKRLRRSAATPPCLTSPSNDSTPPDHTTPTAQPDDPWAGLVQPHWGGDWAALEPPLGQTGAGGNGTAGTTGVTGKTVATAAAAAVAAATAETSSEAPARGDDPWEPHPWASRVQPSWGGAWA